MADRVRYIIDRMAILFQQLQRHKLFTSEEIKAIIQKRTDFEYLILRPELTPKEYETYLQYELQLDQLRELRTKKVTTEETSKEELNQLRVIRSSFIQHINYIYSRALRRFPNEMSLWESQISFLQSKKSFTFLGAALGRAIALFPKHIDFWLKAAVVEIEEKRNFNAARILMQRAIRVNLHQPLLWRKYFEVESLNILRVLEDRKKVFGDKFLEKQPKDDEDWLEKLQRPLMIVFRHATAALLLSSSLQGEEDTEGGDREEESEEEEDLEEETQAKKPVAKESRVPSSEELQAIFHMHFFTIEICASLSRWELVQEMKDFLLLKFSSLREICRHLSRFEAISLIVRRILPLWTSAGTEEELRETLEKIPAELGPFLDETLLLLQKIQHRLEEETDPEGSHRAKLLLIRCEVRETSFLIVQSLFCSLWRLKEELEQLETVEQKLLRGKQRWEELVQSWKDWRPEQSADSLELCQSISVESLSRSVKTPSSSLAKTLAQLKPASEPAIGPPCAVSDLSEQSLLSLKRLVDEVLFSRCSLLLTRRQASPEDLSQLVQQVCSWMDFFAARVSRVERGLSPEWKSVLLQSPQFWALWREFVWLLRLLALLPETAHNSLLQRETASRRSALTVLFAVGEERQAALRWWLESFCDTPDSSLDQLQELLEGTLVNVSLMSPEARREVLLMSLSLCFERWQHEAVFPLQQVERYFFRTWQFLARFPHFFSAELQLLFLRSFLSLLSASPVPSEAAASGGSKRKSLSAGEETVVRILEQTKTTWAKASSDLVAHYSQLLNSLSSHSHSQKKKRLTN